MRVITGSARGRRLKELEGMETRPTTDRVKEGLFSALQFDIEGRRVLDLFAGTGQLGIECLSRGAASAVFVDRRADAVKLIRENLRLTELEDRARVVAGDSMEYLKSIREPFDIIFLDPPYAAGLLEPAIAHIAKFDILAPHGIIAAEHPADRVLPALAPPYRVHRTYRYGKIALTLYRRGGNEQNEEGPMTTAICSGSFDPITLGHLDIIRRAAACFDRVCVCVSPNAEKKNQMFTPEEKLLLVRTAVADLPNVEAELWPGLLADFAVDHGATAIVRGVRNTSDFDVEYQLALINQDIHPGLETMLLPASAAYQHFSSSMAREMIRYGQPLEAYLPASIIPMVRDFIEKKEG